MSATEDIKSRLDIVQYVQQYVPLRRAGRLYKAPCPFHQEKTPSFVVDPDRQSWRCFGACATGGDIFGFAMRQHGWSFPEALEELAKRAGVELKPQTAEQKVQNETVERLRGLLKIAAQAFHEHLFATDNPDSVATLEYARNKRGFTDETIRTFQFGYAPHGWTHLIDYLKTMGYSDDDCVDAGVAIRNDQGRVYDRFRNRLVVAIRDERGRVVGFGARALATEDNPKYLNSPQSVVFDKSRLLFGLDLAGKFIRESETAVIVEGYMDAIQAHQAGYQNVVAQMGTAITETQLKLIAPRWAKKIVFALDADAAGQNATLRSLEVARQALRADYTGKLSVDIRILEIPSAKDPDDLIRESPQEWGRLVETARPVVDFVIDLETKSLSSQASVQEREAVARHLLPILNASENNLYNRDNLQKLALRLRINERDLLGWADEEQKTIRKNEAYQRKQTPSPPVISESSPEFPPFELGEPPPPEDDFGFDAPLDLPPLTGQRTPMPAPKRTVTIIKPVPEQRCLRALFNQPDLFYHINRKLRELAMNKPELGETVLADFSADDFSLTEYKALMYAFEQSLQQDDLLPLDYMRTVLTAELVSEIDSIILDVFEKLAPRLNAGLTADLEVSIKNTTRFQQNVDPVVEFIKEALLLRQKRLEREREEIHYLQREDLDEEESQQYQRYIMLSAQAKRLIDEELKRLSRLSI